MVSVSNLIFGKEIFYPFGMGRKIPVFSILELCSLFLKNGNHQGR